MLLSNSLSSVLSRVIRSQPLIPLPPSERSWPVSNEPGLTQKDVETLSRAVEELKKTTYQLLTHVPSLESQVKTMNRTVVDITIELRAKELSLERTTTAKDSFQR
jgi:septal ring factor EnvC (AmiA/AmiB activator)